MRRWYDDPRSGSARLLVALARYGARATWAELGRVVGLKGWQTGNALQALRTDHAVDDTEGPGSAQLTARGRDLLARIAPDVGAPDDTTVRLTRAEVADFVSAVGVIQRISDRVIGAPSSASPNEATPHFRVPGVGDFATVGGARRAAREHDAREIVRIADGRLVWRRAP